MATYAMTFFVGLDDDELEEWDSTTCRGVEAPSPAHAVHLEWSHCWFEDPATDNERFIQWFEGDVNHYDFHVICREDGSQWIVSFDVVPVEFDLETRAITWGYANKTTVPCSGEHAAEYRPVWVWVTAEQEAVAKAKDPLTDEREGWWIETFEDKASP